MATDGSLNFDTGIDTSGFNSGTKEVQNSATNLYSGLKSSFGKIGAMLGSAFAVTKLVQFGQSAVETASDIAEVQNVVDTAFGDMTYKMEAFADTAVETYGISKLTAKQTGSTYMAMAKGMDLADETASNMAVTLTGLSADMASFYNVEQDVASTALNSIFTGETETLKKFGIVMTDTNLSAFALSQGITKNTSDMTQAEKVQLRYQYVLSQTTLAQGDFAKTSDSWANQTRMLSEKWKEFSSIIGQVLMNVLLPGVQAINNALSALIQYATDAYNALADLFGWEKQESNASQKTAANTAATAQSASNATDSTKKTADAEKKVTKATKDTNKERERGLQSFDELNVMQEKSSSSKDKDSDGAVKLADTAGANAGTTAAKSTKKAVLNGLLNAFKDLYKNGGLADFVGKIQKGINSVDWSAIGNNCKSIFESLKPIAKASFDGLLKVGKSALGALGSFIGGVVSVTGKSLQTVTGGIAKWLKQDGKKIENFINTASTNLSTGFDNVSDFYDTVFGAMGTSIDQMRPVMETSISNMLGGLTEFGISVGTIFTDSFSIATESMKTWAKENEGLLVTTFNNLQSVLADVMDGIGTVFGDIGTILSDWWNGEGGGAEIFDNVCKAFTNVGTTMMNVYNEWIKPAWDFICDVFSAAWEKALKPIFEKLVNFFGKVCDCVATVWNNFLSPFVNWIVKTLAPYIKIAFNAIKGVFETVFGVIGDVIGGILDALGGLLDFITGVFSGDWKKAWKGIKNFFKGIWNAIWGIVKGVVNLIIDGINMLWSGIYMAVKGIVDSIGGIAGAIGDLFGQDWYFSMPEEPPLIPKLATGTVVPANYGEFAAILGDNKREPEVVSPLSTIKQALKEVLSEGGFENSDGDINLTVNLDGEPIFKDTIKRNKAYKKAHGVSAYA